MHSRQPCCSGEDARSVAKDTQRPTLHQIAEWRGQTATTNEISERAKYLKKTLNFLSCAPVGICKPAGFSSTSSCP
ncbi:hypothetical protein PDR5_41690 [Pseudomonas sp. DR 5-09]|nr:hypothetical protein PDR5_41690 [Pseudomonas sp. DR 5-09]